MAVIKLAIIAAGLSLLARGQEAPLQFEVAVIRPAPLQKPGQISTRRSVNSSRLLFLNVTINQVLESAYELEPGRISGPAFLRADRFDITAKMPAGAKPEQAPAMLQALLADRFHLVLHRESREMPFYRLVTDKGGAKLKTAEQATGINSNGNNSITKVNAHTTMPNFAKFLASWTGRYVKDETGLGGIYEIAFECAPGVLLQDDPDAGPSIFTVLPRQLGLRLEGGKGPVDVIVVDHVEAPSEN